MQKIKIEEFIRKTLNLEPLDIKEESSIDISEKEIKILSFNGKENTFMKVNKIFRKKDDIKYIIKSSSKELECTLDHRSFVSLDQINFIYLRTEEIINSMKKHKVFIKTNDDVEEILNIEKTKEKIPIFDLEIDTTHCYYTNDILSHNSFGNPITVSGGTAIPFYSHVRVWVTRSEIDRELGKNKIKFNFVKNKMSVPFKIGVTLYDWKEGFDAASECGDLALEFGIISVTGKKYTLPDMEETITGKKKVVEFLKCNPSYINNVLQPLVEQKLSNREEIIEEPDVQ